MLLQVKSPLRKTVLIPALSNRSNYSALVGVTLGSKSRSSSTADPIAEEEEEESGEAMGKKGAARRKPRKLSTAEPLSPTQTHPPAKSPEQPLPAQVPVSAPPPPPPPPEVGMRSPAVQESVTHTPSSPAEEARTPIPEGDQGAGQEEAQSSEEKRRSVKLSQSEKVFVKRVSLSPQASVDDDPIHERDPKNGTRQSSVEL